MKKLSILLLLCVLFQSCISYKTVNLNNDPIKLSKKYKIVLTNLMKVEGRVIAMTKDTLLLSKENQKIKIPTSSIYDIKERKFSFLKTVAAGAGVYIGVAVIAVAALLVSVL